MKRRPLPFRFKLEGCKLKNAAIFLWIKLEQLKLKNAALCLWIKIRTTQTEKRRSLPSMAPRHCLHGCKHLGFAGSKILTVHPVHIKKAAKAALGPSWTIT
ncbi:hypothetical protein A9R00_11895 [Oleispira antarctica]|uniref:Uncharacterized protein n=1 Tax=Oleispira antarctica TaxID=188908 RepID=A0A1Y5HFJ2_OLEAN|nr:hypothetical protein A9R00_11895 [Oleispira antarctica]